MVDERRSDRAGISRRELLRQAGRVLLAPAALLIAGQAGAASGPPPPKPPLDRVTVFRLRTCPPGQAVRKGCSCNACLQHAQNKVFASQQAADLHRAHKHCNCVIVPEVIRVAEFRQMFLPGTAFARQVFDRRW
jgi:hypothetical protein